MEGFVSVCIYLNVSDTITICAVLRIHKSTLYTDVILTILST